MIIDMKFYRDFFYNKFFLINKFFLSSKLCNFKYINKSKYFPYL